MISRNIALKGFAGSVSAVALIVSSSAFAQEAQQTQGQKATPVTTNAPTDEEEVTTVASHDGVI